MSRGPDDFGGGPPPARSGAVTGVAIVNFLVGGFIIILGLAIVIAGPAIASFLLGALEASGASADPNVAKAAATGGGILATIMGFIGFCCMLFGIPEVIAGFGVLNRRPWGRILTIVMGILHAINAVLSIFGAWPWVVISGGYAIFVLIVMFNSEYAREFRSLP
jgi:hypothetical protein